MPSSLVGVAGKVAYSLPLRHQLDQSSTVEFGDWLVRPLLFDFKSHAFNSEGAFFARILQEVRRRVDITIRRRPKDAWSNPVTLKANWFQELASHPTLSLSDFEDALGYIFDRMGSPLEQIRLVLLLDEMDETLEHALDSISVQSIARSDL